MSMSWIMRSMTTESCCTRGTKGPSRRDSMRMGRSTIFLSSWTAPLKRSTWPDVEHPVGLARDPEQLLGLLEGRRHGLLDEHVRPRLEQVARRLEVAIGRHGDRREVDEARELPVARERGDAVRRGDALAPSRDPCRRRRRDRRPRARPGRGCGTAPCARRRRRRRGCARSVDGVTGMRLLALGAGSAAAPRYDTELGGLDERR